MIDFNTRDSLKMAQKNYDNALKTRIGIADKKQVLTNILLSHAEELIETALDAEDLMKRSVEDKKKISKLEAEIKKLTEKKDAQSE